MPVGVEIRSVLQEIRFPQLNFPKALGHARCVVAAEQSTIRSSFCCPWVGSGNNRMMVQILPEDVCSDDDDLVIGEGIALGGSAQKQASQSELKQMSPNLANTTATRVKEQQQTGPLAWCGVVVANKRDQTACTDFTKKCVPPGSITNMWGRRSCLHQDNVWNKLLTQKIVP